MSRVSSHAGGSLGSAGSPSGPSDVMAIVPGVGVVKGLLGDEGWRAHCLWDVLLVLVLVLGIGLFLVHLILEEGQVLPVEEGVALD